MEEGNSDNLSPADLRYLLLDSLKLYSDYSFFVSGRNPFEFRVNDKSLHLYIKNITSSHRNRPGEARIQIGQSQTFTQVVKQSGFVFFLGYSNKHQVFTAWEPVSRNERINRKQNVSAFTSFATLEKAQEEGIAVYVGSDQQRVVSFRPEYLGLYLENYTTMHESSETALKQLIAQADKIEKTDSNTPKKLAIDNTEYVLRKKTRPRDPKFRKDVTEAYNHTCAFSGIQLDLVEAAHIIPHEHDETSQHVTNGLCLSPLHHEAFDSGLIYLDEDYNIQLDEERVAYLKKVGRDGGLDKFLALQYDKLQPPKNQGQHPSPNTIAKANKIRGITGY